MADEESQPLVSPGGGKRKYKTFYKAPDFWFIFLVPLCLYLLILCFYTYMYYTQKTFCNMFSLVVGFMAFVLVIQGDRNRLYRIVGAASLAAVFAATVAGLFCYDSYGIFSNFYTNARTYTNVVPSEPSAAVSDAGKLVFTDETSVDSTKAIGFAADNGHMYCAAPLHDATETSRIEFWAVGFDCCATESEFTCDSASDAGAHGGIVVFDNNGWFQESRKDYYDKARAKAEAEFDLASVGKPLYVRWVHEGDLGMLSADYESKAKVFILETGAFFAIVFGVLSKLTFQ